MLSASALRGFEEVATDPQREIRRGLLIAAASFLALSLWAAGAPLDEGVHAHGVIAVTGNRQAVQHRDGGVVAAIHVHEGDKVRQGQPLIELAAPELHAAERALTSDYLTLLAQRARLGAERDGRSDLIAPAEFAHLSTDDQQLASQALALQRAQMRARREALDAQKAVLGQRGRQLLEQRSGVERQRQYVGDQARLVADELAGQKQLEAKDLAPLSRIKALERAQADLQRQQASLAADRSSAAEGVRETLLQETSVTRQALEDISADFRNTQDKLSETLPKLVAAREQLARSLLRAPASGTVVGLDVFTIGAVIEPGKPVMEIVPDGKSLVIQARVDSNEADEVLEGETAQVRFISVHNRTLPLFQGTIEHMSADAFTDSKSGRSYFRAEVAVPRSELDRVAAVLGRGKLRPGLPVDVILSVHKRSALQMMVEPLAKGIWGAFREQ